MKRFLGITFMFVSLFVLLSLTVTADNVADYSDVSKDHWAYNEIMNMTKRSLFKGTSIDENGIATFLPNNTMKRSEFIVVLTRFLYADELNAISGSSDPWYLNNYMLALKHGLLTSDELDDGDLTKPCTRQEMSMLLVRAAYTANQEVATYLIPTEKISDYHTVSHEYQSYVVQAYSLGLLVGVDESGTFNPEGILNRAQAATAIYRLIDPSTRIVTNENTISFEWNDGIYYSGEFLDGEAHGFGTMSFPGIGTYTGYFNNGKREGLGTFTWDVGDSYVGAWLDDMMYGEGTYTFADGYMVQGFWAENQIINETFHMNLSYVNMGVGESRKIVAICEPTLLTEPVEWSSSNPEIVSVTGENNLGSLSAHSLGYATITAQTSDGKSTVCDVYVDYNEVTYMSLNYGDYIMGIGDAVDLEANIVPDNVPQSTISWSSSDTSIATVSSDGYVDAKQSGTAIIFAKTLNGLIATCYITVDDGNSDIWTGTWDMYYSDESGEKLSGYSHYSCELDFNTMLASIQCSPMYGEKVGLTQENDYTLYATYTDDYYEYEIVFTSITEQKIMLQIHEIYQGTTSYSTVSYYVLERAY